MPQSSSHNQKPRGRFPVTRWSRIAGFKSRDPMEREKAMKTVCQDYWAPLFDLGLSIGLSHDTAKEETQAFFESLIQNNTLEKLEKDRGKLRTFLGTAFRNFVLNRIEKELRQKRGGGNIVPLDEILPTNELTDQETPDKAYDRRWAETVLQKAMKALEGDYQRRDKFDLFLALQPLLAWHEANSSHSDIGKALGISASRVGVELFRLRQRYSEFVHREVARTVGSSEDIETEIAHLMAAFR